MNLPLGIGTSSILFGYVRLLLHKASSPFQRKLRFQEFQSVPGDRAEPVLPKSEG